MLSSSLSRLGLVSTRVFKLVVGYRPLISSNRITSSCSGLGSASSGLPLTSDADEIYEWPSARSRRGSSLSSMRDRRVQCALIGAADACVGDYVRRCARMCIIRACVRALLHVLVCLRAHVAADHTWLCYDSGQGDRTSSSSSSSSSTAADSSCDRLKRAFFPRAFDRSRSITVYRVYVVATLRVRAWVVGRSGSFGWMNACVRWCVVGQESRVCETLAWCYTPSRDVKT